MADFLINLVKRTTHQYHTEEWRVCTNNDLDFTIFGVFNSSITSIKIWKFGYIFGDITSIRLLPKCVAIPQTPIAETCGLSQITYNTQFHAVLGCPCTNHMRNAFFKFLIDNFNVHLYIELSQLDEKMMYSFLIGGVEQLNGNEQKELVCRCAKIILGATADYSRAIAQVV